MEVFPEFLNSPSCSGKIRSSAERRRKRRSSCIRGRKSICSAESAADASHSVFPNLPVVGPDVKEKDFANSLRSTLTIYKFYKKRLQSESNEWDKLIENYRERALIAKHNETVNLGPVKIDDLDPKLQNMLTSRSNFQNLRTKLHQSTEKINLACSKLNEYSKMFHLFLNKAEAKINTTVIECEEKCLKSNKNAEDIIMKLTSK